jgi:hypothetical protein
LCLFIKEFRARLNLMLLLTAFYSIIISYYSFDLLEQIMQSLSQRFTLDLMLTQLDDFNIILFDLVNISLIMFLAPVLVSQILIFSAPAFYIREKVQVSLLLCCILVSFFFSLILVFTGFMWFYSKHSSQLLSLNLGLSTTIFVNFKKVFFFILVLLKSTICLFLPLNFSIIIIFNYNLLRRNLIKWCLFFFVFAYSVGLFLVDNIIQLGFLFLIELLQLEFLFMISLIVSSVQVKGLFCRIVCNNPPS